MPISGYGFQLDIYGKKKPTGSDEWQLLDKPMTPQRAFYISGNPAWIMVAM